MKVQIQILVTGEVEVEMSTDSGAPVLSWKVTDIGGMPTIRGLPGNLTLSDAKRLGNDMALDVLAKAQKFVRVRAGLDESTTEDIFPQAEGKA